MIGSGTRVAMVLLCGLLTGAVQASEPPALSIAFASNTPGLDIARGDNRRMLEDLIDLLHRYRQQPGIGFLIVGRVDPACPDSQCPAHRLLRARVEALTRHLSGHWPGPYGPFPHERLRWASRTYGDFARADRLQILIDIDEDRIPPGDCPFRVELQEPRLPALARQPQQPAWVPVQAERWFAVPEGTRIRVHYSGDPDDRVHALWQGEGTRNDAIIAGPWRGEAVVIEGNRLRAHSRPVLVLTAGPYDGDPPIGQRGLATRAIGDQPIRWPERIIDSESEQAPDTTDTAEVTQCRFAFRVR